MEKFYLHKESDRLLHNDPITFPSTTGCTKPTVGGKCYVPDSNNISDNVIELLKINPHILDECDVEVLGNILD